MVIWLGPSTGAMPSVADLFYDLPSWPSARFGGSKPAVATFLDAYVARKRILRNRAMTMALVTSFNPLGERAPRLEDKGLLLDLAAILWQL